MTIGRARPHRTRHLVSTSNCWTMSSTCLCTPLLHPTPHPTRLSSLLFISRLWALAYLWSAREIPAFLFWSFLSSHLSAADWLLERGERRYRGCDESPFYGEIHAGCLFNAYPGTPEAARGVLPRVRVTLFDCSVGLHANSTRSDALTTTAAAAAARGAGPWPGPGIVLG